MTKPYPEVNVSEAERFREREPLEIGKAFAREMDRLGNTYALKGETALRFLLNVPRPSRDIFVNFLLAPIGEKRGTGSG